MCGVYPDKDVLTAGDQISSTYEGRHLTFLESELFHPYHSDGYVDKGDPVVAQTSTGYIVGVAFQSATAATDKITIDTEGIWNLMVYADTDDVWATDQTGAVTPGDALFINRVTTGAITAGVGACGISKRRDHATQVPFGFALGSLDNADEGTIAVKIHAQGSFDLVSAMLNRAVASGSMGWSYFGRLTDGASEGLCGYVDGTVLGTNTGSVYGFGSWLCLDDDATVTGLITPLDVGVYSGAAQAGPDVYGMQIQLQLAGAPNTSFLCRLNNTQTITAVYYATGNGSIGYAADATTDSTKCGDIPFVNVAGTTYYIRLYDAAS